MTAADPTPEQVAAGHAFYTKRALAVYDAAILGYFSRVAWKCPARRILQHYNRHVSTNHLDVGVGTGYFLDRLAGSCSVRRCCTTVSNGTGSRER